MQLTQTHDYRRNKMAQAKTLTKDELARVLDYIDTRRFAQRNRAMMLLTHLAGLRIGEVACLRWSDVISLPKFHAILIVQPYCFQYVLNETLCLC